MFAELAQCGPWQSDETKGASFPDRNSTMMDTVKISMALIDRVPRSKNDLTHFVRLNLGFGFSPLNGRRN
jgi:hypothetical protein